MTRRPTFKPSLAQTKRQTQQALDYYRALSTREDAPHIDVGAKPKRAAPSKPGSSGEPVEADVLRAVTQLLARHPLVSVAIRINSGMAYNVSGQPVSFHRLVRGRGVVVDFVGWLTDGRPFAIECKRPGWVPGKAAGDTKLREQAQQWFLLGCEACGGRAGFATSVDEAKRIVEGLE
jgi:hypothetical protein